MPLNADGFYEPEIDSKSCTSCGLCITVCPEIQAKNRNNARQNDKLPAVYGAWSTDDSVRLKSSSGGVFSVLANRVIEEGGAVAGCAWDEHMTPCHRLARSAGEMWKMRGSKYIPSKVGYIYRETLDFVRERGKPVLFSGTPCQIAALNQIAGEKDMELITTCEVICHGVPSLRMFRSYLNTLFDGERVVEYSFRSKECGWISLRAVSESGEKYSAPAGEDPFCQCFLLNLQLNDTCYNCSFQDCPREADISLGDFWGAPKEIYDKKGVSLIAVNNSKGQELLSSAAERGEIKVVDADIRRAVSKNPRLVLGRYRCRPRIRQILLDGIKKETEFNELVDKCYPSSFKRQYNRVVNKLWRTAMLKWRGF